MNQLIIIGNGFDLAHGLKTSYNDFLIWYLQKIVNEVQKAIVYKDDCVDFERWNMSGLQCTDIETLKDFRHFKADKKGDMRTKIVSFDESKPLVPVG